ncbi:hypothetical protein BKA60DRAFT_469703 [Fusarium oxysporum]|nr:hypothetical protein BKA60DRAFT_469703 [Fusarium oxysporum]
MVDLNFIQDRFTKLSLEVSLTTRYLPDPWVSRLSLQQKRSFEALVEEASALSDQARHPYNIQQLFVIWTYTQGSSARSCQKEIKPQSRQLFKVAARHLANSESRTQIVLDAMTLFCITRLFMEHEPRKQILDTLDRFDAILNTGYQADTPLVLDYCLVSLHRVLVASDFLGRSVHLANFVAQLRLPQLMLGMNDCHMDIYWSQRLLSRRSHLCALNATHQQVGLSIKLAPLQLDDEPSDDCITVKVDDQIVSLSQDTDTLILLEDEMGRRSNEEEDLREMANMALRLEARRRRKSTAKELKRSSGSRHIGEKYKHNQLIRRAVLGVYDDGYFPEHLTQGLKKLTDQDGFIAAAVSYGHTFDVRRRIDGVVPASDWTDRSLMMMMPFVLSSNMTQAKRMEFIAEPYVENERASCAIECI